MEDQKIAIVAAEGYFPSAHSVDELWNNIRSGLESGIIFTSDELEAAGIPRHIAERSDFVRRRPILERCELFDADFFGYSALEAEALDPQLRLLMQSAYHVLEEAGGVDRSKRLRTGTFVGVSQSRYLEEHLMRSNRHGSAFGFDYLQMINRKDSAATLVAYKLDLGGPAISVNTACSTSLLAVHLACNSLLGYECDVALAGGAAISSFGPDGVLYVPGGILSKDGRCRPFSADADGTIDGSGVAVVGLKRLEDAQRDGDRIYAVILGSAANNDGADKVGYTAPSVRGQTRVILDALALSGVEPDSIGYLEAHGTGTRLGDPIEIRALTQAYRRFTDRTNYCYLGSIKANIGHLGAAAGVTGLIKAALVVQSGEIPPLVNFVEPNPDLALESSPFRVPTETTALPPQHAPRRAAVSSFGIGGTNVHAIVEEPPRTDPLGGHASSDMRFELCLLSAKSRGALESTSRAIAAYLPPMTDVRLDHLAATLADSRSHMPWRRFEVVESVGQLTESWAKPTDSLAAHGSARSRVAFLFPGQGSQHVGMAMDLYARWKPFAEAFDEVSSLVKLHSAIDLLALIQCGDELALTSTETAQPALFAVSVALAKAWRTLGVEPDQLLGHSVGELAAACIAGVFSMQDAVRLICARGRVMQSATPGDMMAVALDEDTLAGKLVEGVELAVINGRSSCVVAGPKEKIERLQETFASEGIHTRRLHTSHAFHSASMAEAATELAEIARTVRLSPPSIPIVSSVTGQTLTAEQACSPDYWGRAVRAPVQFARSLQTLLAVGIDVALEVGPGTTLTSLVRAEGFSWHAIASQPHPALAARQAAEGAGDKAFLRAAGELWTLGVPVDTTSLVPKQADFSRVALPGYVFESKRYWVEAGSGKATNDTAAEQPIDVASPVALQRVALKPVILTGSTAPSAESAARHSELPLEEALLLLMGRAKGDRPCVLANFDQPVNREAAARFAAAMTAEHDVIVLDGRPFALALDTPVPKGLVTIALRQMVGVPDAWQDALRKRFPASASATPLNLIRLAGAADSMAMSLGRLEAGEGAWLFVDEPDLPAAERLQRLVRARAHLAACGVPDATWLALGGDTPPSLPQNLLDLLDALVPFDGAAYVAIARSPAHPTFSPEDPSKDTAMQNATTAREANVNDHADMRKTIQSIWSKVLGRADVGYDDNFFELGGNSLWALQIVSQMNEAFGCEIHLSELLNSATINEIATLVEHRLLSAVDDDELDSLLSELGDLSEEEMRRILAEVSESGPA